MTVTIPSELVPPEVRAVADELRDRGYTLVGEHYAEAGFGNALMALGHDATLVRLVRDRGRWFVEAAPRGTDEWFAPVVWHAALLGSVPASETRAFAGQAELLLADLDQIEGASAAGGDDLLNKLRVSRDRRAHARRGIPPQ
ncbi:MAG TPA: hypothetical protein VNT03_22320 [Baekduia sp.]|nr:hypothetical protein [Baekduia sp.]